jgi:hypothetical protein
VFLRAFRPVFPEVSRCALHFKQNASRTNAAIGLKLRRVRRRIIILAALLCGGATAATGGVPMPPQRPAEAVPMPRQRPTETVDAAEIVPSPCRVALETIAQIKPLPARRGPGACGGTDLVLLKSVQSVDGAPVTVSPPAELRCEMATEIARWVRADAAPAFAPARLTGIVNYDSYSCRPRNRIVGGKISEHGKGNALDIRAFVLAGGKTVSPVDHKVPHELRASLKDSTCKSFTTVLGPGSDGYHEQHIHFDIASRHGGYRICHWQLREKPVEVAAVIPLPRPRPYETSGASAKAE